MNPSPIYHLPGAPFGPFSCAKFTLTGTLTPAPVYTTDDLGTPHPDPIVADDEGLFPDIFLDPNVVYRLRIETADGDWTDPPLDHDPVNELPEGLTPENIADALGYVPVDPDNAKFTSEARIDYSAPLAVLHDDSIGFRGKPGIVADAGRTLSLDDAGKLLVHDDTSTPNYTIDTNAHVPFPVGTTIYFINVNTGVPVFVRESGVELRIAGSGTSADVSVAQWGEGKLVKYDTDKWQISGSGLS